MLTKIILPQFKNGRSSFSNALGVRCILIPTETSFEYLQLEFIVFQIFLNTLNK